MKHGTHIRLLLGADILLVVCTAQERQYDTVCAKRRLNNVRNIFFLLLIIEVGHILSGYILVLRQIVIGTVRNAPQLTPSEREEILDIGRSLAVEAKLFRIMVTQAQLILFHAERFQPVEAEASPVLEPLKIRPRNTEELQLHLLKLTCTEGKVARCDLITEGLSDLSDTKRQLLSGSTLYVLKVDKDTLRRLRS